jgi:hypothetical protein
MVSLHGPLYDQPKKTMVACVSVDSGMLRYKINIVDSVRQ